MKIVLLIIISSFMLSVQNKVFIDPQISIEEQQRQLLLQRNNQRGLFKKKQNENSLKIKIDGEWQDNNTHQNKKRKLEDFESFKNSQQIQQINYSNQNVDQIVKDAIKASGHESPVIVINHQSELLLPEQQSSEYLNRSNQTDLAQNMNEVSITDIPNLESILDKISKMYEQFYQQLPHQKEDQSSHTEDKKLQNFMLNLKKFTQQVIINSEELMNNINYFERKIHLIQQGEEHMIVFFNYQRRYAKLKTQTSLKSTDEIQQKWHEIYTLSTHYDQEVSKSLKNSYALYRFNYQFAQHIKQIEQSTSQQYTNAVQKFDSVLRLSVTLLEQKQEIEEAVANIKKSLQQIKIISYHVDSNMMQIQSILDGVTYNISNLPEVENYNQGQQEEEVKVKKDAKGKSKTATQNNEQKNVNEEKSKENTEKKQSLFMFMFQLFQFILIMSVVKKYLKEAMGFIKKKDFKSAVSKLEILLMKDCKLNSFELLRSFTKFKVHD